MAIFNHNLSSPPWNSPHRALWQSFESEIPSHLVEEPRRRQSSLPCLRIKFNTMHNWWRCFTNMWDSLPIVPPVYKTSTFDSFLKSSENCLSKAAKTWHLLRAGSFFWHKFKSCSPMLPERIRVLGTLLLSIDAFFGLSLLDWFDSWRIGDLQEIYLLRDLEY